MLSTNTAGTPHNLVLTRMTTTRVFDQTAVETVWLELIERYSSQQLAFNQQISKLRAFAPIKAPKIADELYEFSDLCYVTSTLIPLCPDLRVVDFAIGIADLVRKLPQYLQHRREKFQFDYSLAHQRVHPPFIMFDSN